MRLYKRGKVWWCSFYENGLRRKLSTRCYDKAAAEQVARQFERDAADPDHATTSQAKLTDAFALLLNDREAKAKATPPKSTMETVRFYRIKAGHWRRILQGENESSPPFMLAELSAKHVDQFIEKRRTEGATEHTISKELVTLRAALKLALRAGIWKGQIDRIIPTGFETGYEPKTRFLTYDEMKKLLATLTPDRAARVAFIVATSANWGETERARREHVAADHSVVFLDGTKRKQRRRSVPIVTEHQKTLLAYAMKHAESSGEMLFTAWSNVRRDLERACDRAKLPKCTPNDLRRTCATWLRAQGASVDLLAPVMGHADGRMVERVYGRLNARQLAVRLAAETGSDCTTGVPDKSDSAGFIGLPGSETASQVVETGGKLVPSPGLEPGTRGFSVHCSTN
jgi:integrase